MTSHLDHPQVIPSDNPIITQAVIADIEQRYQESLPNSIYVFPRHKSQQNATDISLDSMNGVSSYNLYTQNPTVTTITEQPHTRHSSKASASDGISSDATKETKSAAQGNKKLEYVKAELDSIEKKVVSLGQEDLLVLYRKTMNAYRETVKETPKSESKAKEAKPLVVKIIKTRDPKTKDLENAYRSQAKSTQPSDRKTTYKKDDKQIPGTKDTRQGKDMTKFSKEFVNFLKEKTTQIKENMKPVLTTETDEEKLDTVRQITELGPVLTEEKPASVEKKSEGKPTPKKTVNLYVCYKSSSVSRSQGPKSRTADGQNKPNQPEEKPYDRLAKATKTVQIIRDGNGIKEIKEVKEDPKKVVKQVVLKEKAFAKAINNFVEKPKETKPMVVNLEKKPAAGFTQNTEGSRDPSRMKGGAAAPVKKGTTMYSDLYKTQKSRQSTDKREKVREFVAKALDLAKTMPAMTKKENLKTIEREEKEDENMIKEFEKIIEEKCEKEKEEKSLAWSAVLASPVTVERKREDIVRPSSTKWNLKVVTHSVVTEYEAKQRRKANEKRSRKYF